MILFGCGGARSSEGCGCFVLLAVLFWRKKMCVLNVLVSSRAYCVMQSYPARELGRRLQVDWARDPREGPRVLMSFRVDFEPMG